MIFQEILDKKLIELTKFYTSFNLPVNQDMLDDIQFNACAEAQDEYNRQSFWEKQPALPTTSNMESGICTEDLI